MTLLRRILIGYAIIAVMMFGAITYILSGADDETGDWIGNIIEKLEGKL